MTRLGGTSTEFVQVDLFKLTHYPLIGAAFALAGWKWARKVDYLIPVVGFCIWYNASILIPALRPIDTPVAAFLLGILIVRVASLRGHSLLTSKLLVRLGVLSYSVYLWQQIFLGPNLRWYSLPAILGVASLSYFAIERPFLRLKDRSLRGRKDFRLYCSP